MLARLVLLFIAVPLLELWLLTELGRRVGWLPTLALVIVTGFLGAALARQQGLATLRRFQTQLATGALPKREMVEGILILLAAAVLLTPGLLTDTAGFLLLIPPTRRWIADRLSRRLASRVSMEGFSPPPPGGRGAPVKDPDVIDVDFTVRGRD